MSPGAFPSCQKARLIWIRPPVRSHEDRSGLMAASCECDASITKQHNKLQEIQVMGFALGKTVSPLSCDRTNYAFDRIRPQQPERSQNRFNAGFWYTGACRRLANIPLTLTDRPIAANNCPALEELPRKA